MNEQLGDYEGISAEPFNYHKEPEPTSEEYNEMAEERMAELSDPIKGLTDEELEALGAEALESLKRGSVVHTPEGAKPLYSHEELDRIANEMRSRAQVVSELRASEEQKAFSDWILNLGERVE